MPPTIEKTTPQILVAALATLRECDLIIGKLQAEMDAVPAQEAALVKDESVPAKQTREKLAELRDHVTDLSIEQKRTIDNRSRTLSHAVAYFGPCTQDIYKFFEVKAQAEKARVAAVLAPFFKGQNSSMGAAFEVIPSTRDAIFAQTNCTNRLVGEGDEGRLEKFVEVILECGLEKN